MKARARWVDGGGNVREGTVVHVAFGADGDYVTILLDGPNGERFDSVDSGAQQVYLPRRIVEVT